MGPGALTYQQQVAQEAHGSDGLQPFTGPAPMPAAASGNAPLAVPAGGGGPTPSGWGFLAGPDYSAAQAGMADPSFNSNAARREEHLSPTVAKDEKKLSEAEAEVQRVKALTAEAQAKASQPSVGAPNPYASHAAPGGAGGGPAAPSFDALKQGYLDIGENPADKRQTEAKAELGRQSAQLSGMTQQFGNESAAQGAKIADVQRGEAERTRLHQIDMANKAQEAEALAKPHRDRYQQLNHELASEKIDPDLIYRGAAGGVRRVASALGVALGAIGAVYGHTENFAQKIVEEQINRSIDAQKANLANKRNVAENEKGIYQMFREKGADDATASAAQFAMGHAAAAQQAEAMAADLKNDDQKRAMMLEAQKQRTAQAQAEQQLTVNANIQAQKDVETRRKEALAAANAAAAKGSGEDAKDVGADLAAQWLRDHPEEVGQAYSTGGKFRNWFAEKTGLDLDSAENKAVRRNVEKVLGGQMAGRVNDERLERGARKFVREEQDVKNLTSAQYQEQIRKEKIKNKGKGPKEEDEGPP